MLPGSRDISGLHLISTNNRERKTQGPFVPSGFCRRFVLVVERSIT